MALRRGTQELKDLDVERVDGVDKPATGRSFLLFKDEAGDQIMKGYAYVANAADAVLKAIGSDEHATVSLKSATALNGLAQVLGQSPVFLQKAVPTQPYEIKEPDTDKRGPADENLGANFTALSMPSELIKAGTLKMKAEAAEAVKGAEVFELKEKGKTKAKDKMPMVEEPDPDDEPDDNKAPWMKAQRAMAKNIEGLATTVADLAKTVKSAIEGEIEKVEKAAAPEKVVVERPKSKQPAEVRKGAGMDEGYEPRFAGSFSDIVFGNGGRGK